MVSQKEKQRCINQILSSELAGKKIKMIKGLYLNTFIDEEEWNRGRYFVFKNVETEKEFSIRSSNLTDVCFRFKKDLFNIGIANGNAFLIANDDVIVYKVNERKIFAYVFSKKETFRLDNIERDEAYKITRGVKQFKKSSEKAK